MDSCEQIRAELVGLLDADRPRLPDGPAAHLLSCADCDRAWNEMRATWRMLGTLAPTEVPVRTLDALRTRILGDLEAGVAKPGDRNLGWPVAISMGSGVVLAAASVGMVAGTADLSSFAPEVLAAVGAVWAALYAGVMFLVIRRQRVRAALPTRWVGAAGLGAMALSLAMSGSFSVNEAVDFCRTSPWLLSLLGRSRGAGIFFAVGTLYALGPLFLAALFLGARAPRHPLVLGIAAGGIFIALALPGMLLQCGAFSTGAALSWILGAVAGSLSGGWAGSLVGSSFLHRPSSDRLI